LLTGKAEPANINLQLSRWTSAGRIYQLRRGLYTLAPPYQRVRPHPFLVANHLSRGSYVSLQSALAYFGLIPETVLSITSVTPGRTEHLETPLGRYDFRHLQADMLFGYRRMDLGGRQSAHLSQPAKALLDLVYLQAGGGSEEYLDSLRLQNLDRLDLNELKRMATRTRMPKLLKASEYITYLAENDAPRYRSL
jgi:predicted transcriptional regulator of viral defense system